MACDPAKDHQNLQPCMMLEAMYAGNEGRVGSAFFAGAVDSCLNALISALFGPGWADRDDLCLGNYEPGEREREKGVERGRVG